VVPQYCGELGAQANGAPEDLSERTQAILRHREWLSRAG